MRLGAGLADEIKSQLLCQLSYAPGWSARWDEENYSTRRRRASFAASPVVRFGEATCAKRHDVQRQKNQLENRSELEERTAGRPLTLELLPDFCRQRRIPRWRLTWRPVFRGDRRPMFDSSNHRRFLQRVGIRHGSKALLAAHAINHALLPARKHRVRKNGKIAKHPEHVHAL